MKKLSYLSLFCLMLLLIVACGKTNYLQWADTNAEQDTVELSKQALNDGKFNKAKYLLEDFLSSNPNDPEANILYAQSLMGVANVTLVAVIDDLTKDNPHSDSPLLRLQATVASANRQYIYQAADIFSRFTPEANSDKVIGAICTLVAASTIMAANFDPTGIGIENLATPDTDNVLPIWNDMTWDGQPKKHLAWISRSMILLTSFAEGDIEDSINDANTAINSIEAYLPTSPTGLPWGVVRYVMYNLGTSYP